MRKVNNRSTILTSWPRTLRTALALGACVLATPVAAGSKTAAAVPAAAAPQPARPAFAGVWELAKLQWVVLPEVAGKLTPEAQANADLFKKHFDPSIDDPAKVCLIKGMPWTMLNRARNYPTQIDVTEKNIYLTIELYDQFRVIHMDGQQMPKNYAPSPQGWSVGTWEGDTLVITTTGLTALHPIGPFTRTEEAKVTERWQLKQDAELGEILEIEMQVEDPAIYTEPARAHQILKRSPAGIVPGGYNCSQALWDDHIERRKTQLKIQP